MKSFFFDNLTMSETDGTMATEDGFNNDLAYPKDDFENELAYLNHMTSNGNESEDNDTYIFGGKNFKALFTRDILTHNIAILRE